MSVPVTQAAAEALPNVLGMIPCAGCGRDFVPSRTNRRHCKPSCRGLALARRRSEAENASDEPDDQLAGLFE